MDHTTTTISLAPKALGIPAPLCIVRLSQHWCADDCKHGNIDETATISTVCHHHLNNVDIDVFCPHCALPNAPRDKVMTVVVMS